MGMLQEQFRVAEEEPREDGSVVEEARGEHKPCNWQHKEPRGDKRDIMSLLSPHRTRLLLIVEGQCLLSRCF